MAPIEDQYRCGRVTILAGLWHELEDIGKASYLDSAAKLVVQVEAEYKPVKNTLGGGAR